MESFGFSREFGLYLQVKISLKAEVISATLAQNTKKGPEFEKVTVRPSKTSINFLKRTVS